jgi:hypothetical protein
MCVQCSYVYEYLRLYCVSKKRELIMNCNSTIIENAGIFLT